MSGKSGLSPQRTFGWSEYQRLKQQMLVYGIETETPGGAVSCTGAW